MVFVLMCYYLILGIFGFFIKKEKKNYELKNKFVLLIVVYNEEVVIGSFIESMLKFDYFKYMYDIFVIVDNCIDNIVKIVKGYGVNVCERIVKDKRGKGYVLEWMFVKLFKMDK